MWRSRLNHYSSSLANSSANDVLSQLSVQTTLNFSDSSIYLNRSNVFSRSHSNVIFESEHHSLKAHGSVLPVLLVNAISSESISFRSISVTLAEYGWAWLVCSRRLFVWKYIQSNKSKIESFELQLPASDLLHKADLICLMPPQSSTTSTPGVIAVSPEGIIRYWPNVAHAGHSIETVVTDLQGQECYSLTSIDPYGFILGTTTSSLLHIVIKNNIATCRTLKIPQGVLAGFGHKVSSLLFGALPTSQLFESKQLVKVIQGSSETDSEISIFVLAALFLQKWLMFDINTEKMIFEYDLKRNLIEAFMSNVWNQEQGTSNQIQVWTIDLATQGSLLLILVAAVNSEISNSLYYAIAAIEESSFENSAPLQFHSFTVLKKHVNTYSHEDEENLLSVKLLTNSANVQLVYVYDHSKIFCVQLQNDVVDTINMGDLNNQVLGAGLYDGNPLIFTSKDSLVSLIPDENISVYRDVFNISPIEADNTNLSGSPIDNLKTCFRSYRRNEMRQCNFIVSSFLSNFFDSATEVSLDEIVVGLSQELCDEAPAADPRWAESSHSTSNPETTALLLLNQLQDKLKTHLIYIDFLKNAHIWPQLSLLNHNGSLTSTQLILFEHAEKIIIAITLKKLQEEYFEIIDAAILKLLSERGETIHDNLKQNDIFYRQVTAVHELIFSLIQVEEEELLASLSSPKDCLRFIIANTDIMINVFQEVCRFRQSQGSLYDGLGKAGCEYISLTATVGPYGIRTALLKQLDILVKNAHKNDPCGPGRFPEEDIQLKGLLYQKIMDLNDIILDGYVCQLKSIDQTSERYRVVNKCYEADRLSCLKPLLAAKQYERAASLAEKYEDFDTLIRICEELDNRTKLNRYIEQFKSKGFSEYLFTWYMKEGKQGKMLMNKSAELSNFLKDYENINWLHYIHLDKFEEAAVSLKSLANKEKDNNEKKKTLLSLNKLCLYAVGEDNFDELDKQITELESVQE